MLNNLTPLLTQAKARKRGRKAKPRPVYVSKRLEVAYTKALLGMVEQMHEETKTALTPLLTPQVGDSIAVGDGLLDRFTAIFSAITKAVKDKVASFAKSIASSVVKQQQQSSDAQLVTLLKTQTGLDFTGLMRDEDLQQTVDEAIAANVGLIKSIPEQYFDRIEQAVMTGIQGGTLSATLADDLQKAFGVTKSRAKLIATDQLGKINSRLSQIRQQKLGITHYTWSTSHDERVRPEHKLRDGKLFAWDNPPSDGHPGQPIRCRCVAKPYTEHLTGGKSPDEIMNEQAAN